MVTFTDLLKVPFKDGGRDMDGLDCYGLAIEVFKRYGISLPDYKISCMDFVGIDSEITNQKQYWIKCDPTNLPVPCIVVMRIGKGALCNHCGVYIGNGRFIHTLLRTGVHISRLDHPMWRNKIDSYYYPSEEVLTKCKNNQKASSS